MIQTILAGLLALAVLVVVHEFGHFIIAKIFKVGVPIFSVGMGPRLFGFRWGGTDYRLSALPVGGYVKMAGADPFGDPDAESDVPSDQDFMKKPIWQRLLILLGGPAANLLLPVVVFTVALMMGAPASDTTVGQVVHDSAAEKIGFLYGDVITEVDGQKVEIWNDLEWYLSDDIENDQVVQVQRGGSALSLTVPANTIRLVGAGIPYFSEFGLLHGRVRSQVGVHDEKSPAGVAGLRTGDAIISVDGEETETWVELMSALSVDENHELTIMRASRDEAGQPKIEELKMTLLAQPSAVDELQGAAFSWLKLKDDPFGNPWGLSPAYHFVGGLVPGDPADEAGIQTGDRLYAVNGEPVRDWMHLRYMVGQAAAGLEDTLADIGGGGCFGGQVETLPVQSLSISLIREGERIERDFVPKMKGEPGIGTTIWRPIMGVFAPPDASVRGPSVNKKYGLVEAARRGSHQSILTITHIMNSLGGLLTGGQRVKDSLGGPVKIFSVTAKAWEGGLFAYAGLIATISISLGVVNLLPVPVLDGGQILIFLIEGVRGRPVSPAFREKLQMVGVLFLVALLLAVTFFDIESCMAPGP